MFPTPAMSIVVEVPPHPPVLVGASQTFRVATNSTTGQPQFEWDFGDGSTLPASPKSQVAHTYNRPGHYAVIVFVTTGSERRSISFVQTVHEPLSSKAPITPAQSCLTASAGGCGT